MLKDVKDLMELISGEIYKDLAQPAAKEVGEQLEIVAKTVRCLMFPLEVFVAATRPRLKSCIRKISSNVNEENFIEGHPQVVLPALEGLCYAQEDSIISELFINLLSKAIDKTKLDLAHPAFAKIIQQLSPDEAVVLFFLKKRPYKLREKVDSDIDFDSDVPLSEQLNRQLISDEFPISKLTYSQHISLYMDHLHSLNLAELWATGPGDEIIDKQTKKTVGSYLNKERRLTPFGRLFSNACVPDNYQDL